MNKEDAIKVVQILQHADGGCEACACSLLRDFQKVFPNTLTVNEIHKALEDHYWNSSVDELTENLE